jgi:hypothetical protein
MSCLRKPWPVGALTEKGGGSAAQGTSGGENFKSAQLRPAW